MNTGKYKKIFYSKSAKQAGVLYISLLLSMVLGIITSVVNTRFLGASGFGEYKLIQTTWFLCMTFVTFGLFTTTGNMLAIGDAKKERVVLGHGVVLSCIISVFLIAVLLPVSFILEAVYGELIGSRLRLFLVLILALPFADLLRETLRATNNIYLLSLLNALPQIFYLLTVFAIIQFVDLTVDVALTIFLISILLTTLTIIAFLKPKWNKLLRGVKEIVINNKDLGKHIYVAVVVGAISVNSSQYIIAYLYSTKTLALFVLAITLTMPLTMIPNVVATTLFKKFVSASSIPPIVIVVTLMISVVSLVIFLLLIGYIVPILYGIEFQSVVILAKICAIAAIIHGTADIFNRFLLAKSEALKLRRNGIQLAILGFVSHLVLINSFGIIGAPITYLIVAVVYLSTMLRYYLTQDYNRIQL